MRYVLIGLSTILFYLACSDSTSSGDGNDQNTDQNTDPNTDQNTDQATEITDAEALWSDAWSILGTSCGSAGACHNMSNGGPRGVNLPADDEATAKANAITHKDKIRSEVASGGMPKGSVLSEEARAKVTDWIDAL